MNEIKDFLQRTKAKVHLENDGEKVTLEYVGDTTCILALIASALDELSTLNKAKVIQTLLAVLKQIGLGELDDE